MKKLLFIFFLLGALTGVSKPYFYEPYFLTSPNGEFYLKSIVHGFNTYNTQSRTDVFRSSDSTLIYSIPRYFDSRGILLSNDGQSIFYVERFFVENDDYLVRFYKNGVIEKVYELDNLTKRDTEDYFFYYLYSNIEAYKDKRENGKRVFHDSIPQFKRRIIKCPLFTNGESAFIATKDEKLIQFNLSDGKIEKKKSLDRAEDLINENFIYPNVFKPKVKQPNPYKLPLLINGSSFEDKLGEEFYFKCVGRKEKNKEKNCFYRRLDIECIIDFEGNCIKAKVDFADSLLNQQIEKFILNLQFDSNAVPELYEVWRFIPYNFYCRDLDSLVAISEQIEYKEKMRLDSIWRSAQDSLNGLYIPKDIEDALAELDKILSKQDKKELKVNDPINYHMGLGAHLRTRWGLWYSSRLKAYFLSIGITHPDNMTSITLEYYHKYLNNISFDLSIDLKRN